MVNENHNNKVYSVSDVADIVDRTAQSVVGYLQSGKIEHQRIGRTYLIGEKGLEQICDLVKNAKPGPKGPRKKTAGRKKTV